MRALRDFNIPKIVTDDVPIFMGLIGDLFPALDVPRKRDLDFEKIVRKSVTDLKLQAEDNFVLKVFQNNNNNKMLQFIDDTFRLYNWKNCSLYDILCLLLGIRGLGRVWFGSHYIKRMPIKSASRTTMI